MARQIRTYEPEGRAYSEDGLYCSHCGNTQNWQIDLRLKHKVENMSSGLSVSLDELQTRKILFAIQNNLVNMVDKSVNEDKAVFQCANCENTWIDFHESIVECCLWNGCPGCFHCGQWIGEDELLETCTDCITEKKGDIDEAYCDSGCCPVSDFGLREVMDHYGTHLTEIKESLGWF